MMATTRRFTYVVLGIAAAFGLAACGGAGQDSDTVLPAPDRHNPTTPWPDNNDGETTLEDDPQSTFAIDVDTASYGYQFPAALAVRALDAKVQVTFDPAAVWSYRLIGYENRAVADEDFRNDRVDGGEVGPGHSVTDLSTPFDRSAPRLRVCYAAAFFAEALRGGREASLDDLVPVARRAGEETGDPAVRDLTSLIGKAGDVD
jgi:Domain of unknown function (DUF3520)